MVPLLIVAALAASPPVDAPDTVLVPAGELLQGSGRTPDEPLRRVHLSAFRVDRHEVSVAEFERFAVEGYAQREWWSDEGLAWLGAHPEGAGALVRAADRPGSHPVVAVTWYEASAYCRWRGGALPTEAQWERAACGEGGRRYPWGEDEGVDAPWYTAGREGHLEGVRTRAVDEQPEALASPFGLVNVAGNVWEWTADWYHRDAYLEEGSAADPVGPEEGTWRSLRGGSFMNLASYCTCSHREPARPERVAFTTGFRCVYPAAP